MDNDELRKRLQEIADVNEQHLMVVNPETGEAEPVLAEPIGIAMRCKTNVGEWQFSWNYQQDEDAWVATLHFQCPHCDDMHAVRLDDGDMMMSDVTNQDGEKCSPNGTDFFDACDHLHSLGHHLIDDQVKVVAKMLGL